MAIVAGIVMAGLAVASSIKNSRQQGKQADADRKTQRQLWELQKADTRENYRQLASVEQQEQKEYKEQLLQNQTSLSQQKAAVELMAAASGTGGNSVDAMMTDLTNTAGQNQAQIVSNYENQQQSIANQYRSIQKGGAMEMRRFNKPSTVSTLTGSISSGLQGFMGGYQAGAQVKSAYDDWRTPSQIKTN